MSLTNVSTANNTLKATDDAATAVSNPKVQDIGGDWREIKAIAAEFNHLSISTSAEPDKMQTCRNVGVGEVLTVIDSNGTMVEKTVSAVSGDGASRNNAVDWSNNGTELAFLAKTTSEKTGVDGFTDSTIYLVFPFIYNSGKYYWEYITASANTMLGIQLTNTYITSYLGSTADSYGFYPTGGVYNNSTNDPYGASYGISDTVGCSYDTDTRELEWYINGVGQGVYITLPLDTDVYPAATTYTQNATMKITIEESELIYKPADCRSIRGTPFDVSLSPVTGTITDYAYRAKTNVAYALSGAAVDAIQNSGLEEFTTVRIMTEESIAPIMTDFDTPAGIIRANSMPTTSVIFSPFYLFDGKPAGTTYASYYVSTEGAFWVEYESQDKAQLTKFAITNSAYGGTYSPKDFNVKGSNTGAFAGEEVLLSTVVNSTWIAGERKEYLVNGGSTAAFKFFRLYITASESGAGGAIISGLEFFGYKEKLVCNRTYNDILGDVGSQSVVTTVDIPSKGDEMISLTADLWT